MMKHLVFLLLLAGFAEPFQELCRADWKKFAYDVVVGWSGEVPGALVASNPPGNRVLDTSLKVEYFRHDFKKDRKAPYNCVEESYSLYEVTPLNAEHFERNQRVTCGGAWGVPNSTAFTVTFGDYSKLCESTADTETITGVTRFRYTQVVSQSGSTKPAFVRPCLSFTSAGMGGNCEWFVPSPANAVQDLKNLAYRSSESFTQVGIESGLTSRAYFGYGIQSVTDIPTWLEK